MFVVEWRAFDKLKPVFKATSEKRTIRVNINPIFIRTHKFGGILLKTVNIPY